LRDPADRRFRRAGSAAREMSEANRGPRFQPWVGKSSTSESTAGRPPPEGPCAVHSPRGPTGNAPVQVRSAPEAAGQQSPGFQPWVGHRRRQSPRPAGPPEGPKCRPFADYP
jgi:hypothetical protein